MYRLTRFFSKQTISVVMIGSITAITLATSAYGAMKVAGSFNSFKSVIPEIKHAEAVVNETENTTAPVSGEDNSSNNNSASKGNTSKNDTSGTTGNTTLTHPVANASLIAGTGQSTTNGTSQQGMSNTQSTVSSTATNNNNSQCIITLFGKQFNVTSLQTSHTGGNIFNCGTDMTAVYQTQHGTDLTRMQPYLVTSTGTGSGINNYGNSGSGGIGSNTGNNTGNTGSNNTGTGTTVSTKDNDVEDVHEDKPENHNEDRSGNTTANTESHEGSEGRDD